jgi:predicted esterase
MRILPLLLCGGAFALASLSSASDLPPIAPIARPVPPPGVALSEADRTRLSSTLAELEKRLAAATSPLKADVEIFTKAVRYALAYDEFWDAAKDPAKADWALSQAKERLDQLAQAPWSKQTGPVVRGFVSQIDGAVQPYGLVIPEKLDLGKPVPLYIWLHGRGEKSTDLYFLNEHAHGVDQVHPDDAIVVHPLGRQCVGFQGAGEQDVLEAVADVSAHYKIDPERIVLMGFSMGGGGSKHLGAHYTDRFCCIHTGAGYSETAQFCHVDLAATPAYEQTLWGVDDVPDYVRNLFNIPFSCYSGEKDGQMQAAKVLEAAFAANGKTLVHLIGPGVAHKYEPETLKQCLKLVHDAVVAGRPHDPPTLTFQTRTLRYNRLFWLEALGLGEHWKDSRIDAQGNGDKATLTTVNISALRVSWPGLAKGGTVAIDGQAVAVPAGAGAQLIKDGAAWRLARAADDGVLRKQPGLQGPIDDAFVTPFLVVEPSGHSADARFQRWVDFESAHFHERWATIMRGDLRSKRDSEVTDDDIKRYNLVLWGDAASNKVIARLAAKLPVTWDDKAIAVGSSSFARDGHVLALIYPNPLNPAKYVVINSALTFREAADQNNAQQNPKLPDWVVIDLAKDPNASLPGGIAAAGFFDERWQAR